MERKKKQKLRGCVTVRLEGGLGNQMWQYACCERLRRMGKKARIDDYDVRQNSFHQAELLRVFRIQGESISALLHWLWRVHLALWFRINKLIGKSYREVPFYYVESEERICEAVPLSRFSGYCTGYWQGAGYLEGIEERIRGVFRFPELNEENRQYGEQIRDSVSVSVHIRGGDYLNEYTAPLFGNICTAEYYEQAIRYILEKESGKNVRFFVFTNDPDYAKGLSCMDGRQVTYITGNEGKEAFRDMQLMSMCRHNIIANSSFSFWGAWLNGNPDKIVVAPARWKNREEIKNMCPAEWVRI